MPANGPSTKNVNPKVQPIKSTITGKSQIDILAIAKPSAVCLANAVPIYIGSDNSEIIAEYWGESGTTVSPQIIAITRARRALFRKKPIINELEPLIINIMILNFDLPILSAIFPPIMFPAAPLINIRKVPKEK